MSPAEIALDPCVEAVRTQLAQEALEAPDALLLLATGAGLFAERLESARSAALPEADPVPARWRGGVVHQGRLGDLAVWLLEDPLDTPSFGTDEPTWSAGFPCWLAAAAGARVLVHTSAGAALPTDVAADEGGGADAPPPGGFGIVRDHLNLSGRSPLVGLGETRLGPLFPDLTTLHDAELRAQAIERATALGLDAREVVVACTHGPSLETPAESRWLAHAGAQVSVQELAAPLLAAAHAGLRVLSIVAVGATAGAPADLPRLVEEAQRAAPALEDLLVALAPDLAARVQRARAADLP